MAERIGFIGLGIMGRPMALNLRAAGHELAVYARRAEALTPLTDAGAHACDSPAAVAREADIVFTMLGDTADVEEVILGASGTDSGGSALGGTQNGNQNATGSGTGPTHDTAAQAVIAGAAPGCVVVDMSTISPIATRRIAARLAAAGVSMLDAPVSGGDIGARDGTLSIMVGGPAAAFARVKPLLEVLGRNIVHIGDSGAGQVCKACNQIVVGQTIAGVGEALLLAEAAGVDGARVREALLGGFAGSRILEVHGQRMLAGDYQPGFKAALHQKDMRIVQETAHALGLGLPGAALVAQLLNALVGGGEGGGELDSAALHLVQRRLNGRGGEQV
ncbi:MAG: NAD(P)-dependent oxidoreductase [Thiohalocapsa sp.]|uniref:NAD(P)-dependent oxidoreductase n=1 Tax=Thiohalocapsa sp. TaxID=2497641 RepID=UPI0025DFC5D9|nr:NAD(P)-dependent oxidoreductase [Thiohalocapsa sp.]MCG6942795.1 NAD(P)-dependent oxidoreductase [Thiohalocapsa sp.]